MKSVKETISSQFTVRLLSHKQTKGGKMCFKLSFTKIILAILFLLVPSIMWASGDTPDDPLLLGVGEESVEITIENPGDVIWVRAEFGDLANCF